LQREASHWIKGLGRKMRANDEIGEKRKRFSNARTDRGRANHDVHRSGRNRSLHTRTIKRVGELLAVAAARAALREFCEQTRPTIAMLAIGIGSIARRKQPTDRGGSDSRHFLDKERHPATKHADVNRILARNRGHLRDAIRPDEPLSPRVQPFQTKQPVDEARDPHPIRRLREVTLTLRR
jgi:hypothetical protein